MKWKIIVVLPLMSACEFACVPFTVKSPGWTVAGSAAPPRLIMKSVGWLNITPGQEAVTEHPAGVGVGVAVAVDVGVEVAVPVAVGVGVTVAVGVGVGPSATI